MDISKLKKTFFLILSQFILLLFFFACDEI